MAWYWLLLIFVVGVALAFPAAVLVCTLCGYLLKLIGTRCPKCGKRTLECWWSVRSDPPSPSFYKCSSCGARFRRLFDGPWEDASGAEWDQRYVPGVFGSMKQRGKSHSP